MLGGLSLIGVPGTVGFISKWYLVVAALEKGWYPIAVLILISSFLAVIYIWRVIEVLFFRESDIVKSVTEAPISMLIPTWMLIGGTLYFGLQTEWTAGVASSVANSLLGGPH